jgi:hypothetical protein
MNSLGKLVSAASLFSLTGCAGVVTAFKNDPLQAYPANRESVYAMTGDRRTAVMMNKDSPLRFCAESLPDAVAAFSASSKASIGIEGKAQGGFSDSTAAGLLQTFQRTEIAEVFRQLGWNTCLAWAQGAIDEKQYFGLLEKMVVGGLDVMTRRASQTQVVQAVPNGTLIVTAQSPADDDGKKPEPVKPEEESGSNGGKQEGDKPDGDKPEGDKPEEGKCDAGGSDPVKCDEDTASGF